MRQIIVNTPTGSGLGDTLTVAFGKVNSMTDELYTSIGNLSGSLAKTKTSEFTNDGADGINPFITALDIPTTWTIESITGLTDSLTQLQSGIDSLNGTVNNNGLDIADLQTQQGVLSNQITAINLAIIDQNLAIASLQNQINNL